MKDTSQILSNLGRAQGLLSGVLLGMEQEIYNKEGVKGVIKEAVELIKASTERIKKQEDTEIK